MERESVFNSTRFLVCPDALVKSFNGDIALLHLKNRRIHVLNSTASTVWNLVMKGTSRGEIQQTMLRQFNVNEEQLSTEIDRILSFLRAEGFIQPHE